MLVFMRLVILLSKMFSFHPRGLWPHCVFTPTHQTDGSSDVFVSCGWNLYHALEGPMVKKINKFRSKQKFKKWNLRENFSASCCVNCDVEGIASFCLVSCAFAGAKTFEPTTFRCRWKFNLITTDPSSHKEFLIRLIEMLLTYLFEGNFNKFAAIKHDDVIVRSISLNSIEVPSTCWVMLSNWKAHINFLAYSTL